MARVKFFDKRTRELLAEGDCSLTAEEIGVLLSRHEVAAVDVAPAAVEPPPPAAPAPRARKERKAS